MRQTVMDAGNCVPSFREGRSADVMYWIEVKLHVSDLVT
jgi:hypothetical protein